MIPAPPPSPPELDKGHDVVMLCEGDPFFYGSFMYVFARLARRYPCIVVPGVTSITASAASLRRPLSARNEVVKVLPATLPEDRLRDELMTAESAAIIKVGRHLPKVRTILGHARPRRPAPMSSSRPRMRMRR